MSENIAQVYEANPITSNASTDLMYFGQSPYGAGDDAAMTFENFAAQFAGNVLTTKGDLYTFSTVNARLAVGVTNGQILQVNSSAATGLEWSTATYPVSTTINQLLYSSSANVVAGLATLDNGVLITGTTGIPAMLANGTAGYVLTANSGAPPSWQAVSSSGAITTIDGDAGSVTPSSGAITISGGTTGLTTSGSSATLTLTGTLSTGNGGTGKTSVTISPTASAWAGWDSNKNLSANNFLSGYTTTATAASTTVLTVASTYQQFFTGTTTQTVTMPVTSTLVLGQSFYIVNNSTGVVTIQSSGSNTIITMQGSTTALLTCILTSGTTAASWSADYVESGLTIPVSLADGGTNASLTASNGGIVYSTGSAMAILAGTATAGLALLSGASTTPTWSSSAPLLTAGGTMTGNIAFNPSTAGLSGTTAADNASSGTVGQFISSNITVANAVSLTTSTDNYNVTSISLPAGDWNVWANVGFNFSVSGNAIYGWTNSSSATTPDGSLISALNITGLATGTASMTVPFQRYNVSGSTTVYLSVAATWSTGTASAYGGIYARRAR